MLVDDFDYLHIRDRPEAYGILKYSIELGQMQSIEGFVTPHTLRRPHGCINSIYTSIQVCAPFNGNSKRLLTTTGDELVSAEQIKKGNHLGRGV